jgi:hypothetical protein
MRRSLYLLALSVAIVLALAPAALAQSEGLNCEHFANQETAQAILDAHGDLHEHDVDGDGVACEDLGGGTAEDGTLAPFAQYAQQYQYSGGTVEELADTGGPSLLMPAAAGTLVLGACIVGLFLLAARRGSRAGDLGGGGQMAIDLVGPNAKRLAAVVLAVVLAAVLAAVLGQATTRSASAQQGSPIGISKAVYPSPTNAIPVGTQMDFLITAYNNLPRRSQSWVVSDQLPGGVEFVSANASQGSCYPMADQPVIRCEFGRVAPGNVAHANIIVRATTPGTYTNTATDNLGSQIAATYTIVPARSGGTSVSAGGASVTTCPGGTSVSAGGASVTTGSGC